MDVCHEETNFDSFFRSKMKCSMFLVTFITLYRTGRLVHPPYRFVLFLKFKITLQRGLGPGSEEVL